MHIYFEVDFQEQAQHYQAVLHSRGVTVDLQPIENSMPVFTFKS